VWRQHLPVTIRPLAVAAIAVLAAVTALLFLATGTTQNEPGSGGAGKPAPAPAVAAVGPCVRFAAPDGSDAAAGTKRRPFQSAQRLLDSLRAGQTGCLRRGHYRRTFQGYVLRFDRAGRPSAPITIRSYPGERATVHGIVTIPSWADHVRLSGLRIEGTGDQNTVKVYATGVVVSGNRITNRNRGLSCMILGSNDDDDVGGPAVAPVIRGNVFTECGSPANENKDHGIYAANVHDGHITGNVMSTPSGYAIHLYPNAQRTLVARNVIDGSGSIRGGIVFAGDDRYASSGNVVEHNVIAYPATYAITSNWEGPVGEGNVVRANCVWAEGDEPIDEEEGFSAEGNLVAPPRFRDPARADYRLRPDSRCAPLVGPAVGARAR
jgi:Right handed beta helix region